MYHHTFSTVVRFKISLVSIILISFVTRSGAENGNEVNNGSGSGAETMELKYSAEDKTENEEEDDISWNSFFSGKCIRG